MNFKEYEIITLKEAFFAQAVTTANHHYALDLEDADSLLMFEDDLESLRRAENGDTIYPSHTQLVEQNGAYYHDLGLVEWVRKDDGSYLIKCVSPHKLLYRLADF